MTRDYKAGDLVRHRVFGSGVILKIDRKAGAAVVKFDSLPTERNIALNFRGMRKEA